MLMCLLRNKRTDQPGDKGRHSITNEVDGRLSTVSKNVRSQIAFILYNTPPGTSNGN